MPAKIRRCAKKRRNSKIVKQVSKVMIAKKLEKHYT